MIKKLTMLSFLLALFLTAGLFVFSKPIFSGTCCESQGYRCSMDSSSCNPSNPLACPGPGNACVYDIWDCESEECVCEGGNCIIPDCASYSCGDCCGGGGGVYCGNGVCEVGEDEDNCPDDCGGGGSGGSDPCPGCGTVCQVNEYCEGIGTSPCTSPLSRDDTWKDWPAGGSDCQVRVCWDSCCGSSGGSDPSDPCLQAISPMGGIYTLGSPPTLEVEDCSCPDLNSPPDLLVYKIYDSSGNKVAESANQATCGNCSGGSCCGPGPFLSSCWLGYPFEPWGGASYVELSGGSGCPANPTHSWSACNITQPGEYTWQAKSKKAHGDYAASSWVGGSFSINSPPECSAYTTYNMGTLAGQNTDVAEKLVPGEVTFINLYGSDTNRDSISYDISGSDGSTTQLFSLKIDSTITSGSQGGFWLYINPEVETSGSDEHHAIVGADEVRYISAGSTSVYSSQAGNRPTITQPLRLVLDSTDFQAEVNWVEYIVIADSTMHQFRLYPVSGDPNHAEVRKCPNYPCSDASEFEDYVIGYDNNDDPITTITTYRDFVQNGHDDNYDWEEADGLAVYNTSGRVCGTEMNMCMPGSLNLPIPWFIPLNITGSIDFQYTIDDGWGDTTSCSSTAEVASSEVEIFAFDASSYANLSSACSGLGSGVGGVSVVCSGPSCSPGVTQNTAGDGNTSFTGLSPGSYTFMTTSTPSPYEQAFFCDSSGGSVNSSLPADAGTYNLALWPDVPGWWQAQLGDVHADNGNVDSEVPATCDTDSGCYDSILLTQDPDDPDNSAGGIVSTPGTVSAGEGFSNQKDWTAEGTVFNGLENNYQYFYGLVRDEEYEDWDEAGLELGDGYFVTTDNKTVSGEVSGVQVYYTEGNLTINGDLTLADSDSFVAFIVGGTVSIQESVTSVEGVVISDGMLTVEGNGASDDQFVGEGIFVSWGGVNLNRSLEFSAGGGDNRSTPAEKFVYNPDLLRKAPDVLKKPRYTWVEVAP